ncbi:MAG: hypothetical protein WDZ59_00220 [Pirellulales bacterium]
MTQTQRYESLESQYRVQSRESDTVKTAERRRSSRTRQRSTSPSGFNGLHRRRRKRVAW